jgi:copper chaperone CopZ
MYKSFVILLFLLLTQFGYSKIVSAEIGVNGLTCSMCSRSVELAIKKLDFVEGVEMDLEKAHAIIKFKPEAIIDFKKIAKAVKDAGFSVRFLKLNLDTCPKLENSTITINQNVIQIYGNGAGNMEQKAITLTLFGNDFMEKKQLKKWQAQYAISSTSKNNTKNYLAIIE